MIRLAFDPDTHTTGWAMAIQGTLIGSGVIRSAGKSTGHAAVTLQGLAIRKEMAEIALMAQGNPVQLIIEDQEITKYRRARPSDILRLAHVAGAIEQAAREVLEVRGATRWLNPTKWTGSLPKHIHQGRALTAFGYSYKKTGTGKSLKIAEVYKPESGHDLACLCTVPKSSLVHVLDAVSMLRAE